MKGNWTCPKNTGTHGKKDDSTDEEITMAVLLGWCKQDGSWKHTKYPDDAFVFASNALGFSKHMENL